MNFNEYIENIVEKTKLETLENAVNLQEVATDVFLDMLEDEEVTHSDLAFAEYIINRYKDVLNSIIDDQFEIEYVGEIECDGDCESCPCCE